MSFKMYRSDPLTEREKRHLRKVRGTKQPFAADLPTSDKPKERDYTCPTNIIQTISRKKKRGFNGCKMSDEARAEVLARRAMNEAFHGELRAIVKRGAV